MNNASIASYIARELTERRLEDAASRRQRAASARTIATATSPVEALVIRRAGGTDREALERLALLDSREIPGGELLVAEVQGELLAALSIQERSYIADPFHRTGDVVALLDARATSLRAPAGIRARIALSERLRLRPTHVRPSH